MCGPKSCHSVAFDVAIEPGQAAALKPGFRFTQTGERLRPLGLQFHGLVAVFKRQLVRQHPETSRVCCSGAVTRNRTLDKLLTRQLLYQLSYNGETGWHAWTRTRDLTINSRLLYQLSYVPNKSVQMAGAEVSGFGY